MNALAPLMEFILNQHQVLYPDLNRHQVPICLRPPFWALGTGPARDGEPDVLTVSQARRTVGQVRGAGLEPEPRSSGPMKSAR